MIVLGVDFETQGVDANTTNPTEVGAILATVDGTKWTTLERLSGLIWEPGYPPQPKEIVELTGITDEMLRKDSWSPKAAFTYLNELLVRADVVLAHNKQFDQTVYKAASQRIPLVEVDRPWICTVHEMPYPPKYTCKKLAHLSLDHGLKMDGRELHRAIHDVELMCELVGKYDMDMVVAYAREPNIVVRIVIPKPWEDNNQGKEAAIRLGYGWEHPRNGTETYPKCWVKKIKESQFEVEVEKASYQVVRLT